MENKIFLNYHKKIYPNLLTEDKLKLIYQASMGPNHNINELTKDMVYNHILDEINTNKTNNDENIYEWISNDYIRMNLLPIKNDDNKLKSLVDSFISSISNNDINILKQNIKQYLNPNEYINYNYKPLHHSLIYRNSYNPHYLLINKQYLNIETRVNQLSNFIDKQPIHSIIALEGKCTSGKTTISKYLSNIYTIIHVDDFFLNQEAKTVSRLQEIGGNIDYKLLYNALSTIKSAYNNNEKSIKIKVFNCSKQEYYLKNINLQDKVLLEGVYSTHPFFREFINKIAYLYIDDITQLERINQRDLKNKFINEWIPLENIYFKHINILTLCDIII